MLAGDRNFRECQQSTVNNHSGVTGINIRSVRSPDRQQCGRGNSAQDDRCDLAAIQTAQSPLLDRPNLKHPESKSPKPEQSRWDDRPSEQLVRQLRHGLLLKEVDRTLNPLEPPQSAHKTASVWHPLVAKSRSPDPKQHRLQFAEADSLLKLKAHWPPHLHYLRL